MVEDGVGGVEVLRPRGVVVVGPAASDEGEHGGVGAEDREQDPVAEPVDEAAGAGGDGQAGGEQLGVAHAAAAEVVGQAGPPGGGLPRPVERVAVQVDTEPLEEVVPSPGVGERLLVEARGGLVQLRDPFRADR